MQNSSARILNTVHTALTSLQDVILSHIQEYVGFSPAAMPVTLKIAQPVFVILFSSQKLDALLETFTVS